MKHNLTNVLEDLYESEINFHIGTFWDAGYDVFLGDHLNGYIDESLQIDTIEEVAQELIRMAIEHYPDSDFAVKYQ